MAGQITKEFQGKLQKLVDLEVIPDIATDVFADARSALEFAQGNEVVSSWTDFGNNYTITFTNGPTKTIPTKFVGEKIVDRILELISAPDTVATEPTPKKQVHNSVHRPKENKVDVEQ